MNHLKFLSIAISMVLLIWGVSVSYYFLVTLPEQNDRKIRIREEELGMKKEIVERAENEKLAKKEGFEINRYQKNQSEHGKQIQHR